MEVVVDTSVILAILLNEPEKKRLIALTKGRLLIAPQILPWEIGNALSAMFKKNRISLSDAQKIFEIFQEIPIQYVPNHMAQSLSISYSYQIYAYDAYFIDCAVRHAAPLLTLDKQLKKYATQHGCSVMEV